MNDITATGSSPFGIELRETSLAAFLPGNSLYIFLVCYDRGHTFHAYAVFGINRSLPDRFLVLGGIPLLAQILVLERRNKNPEQTSVPFPKG